MFIFQDQVIQAAMALAGFTAGQAEMLRKAMSRKRSREAMEALKNDFLAGAAARGVTPAVATTVYEKILAFSSFGFPKSHAAAMAETRFKVAWLKRYYPVEFYCALLNEQNRWVAVSHPGLLTVNERQTEQAIVHLAPTCSAGIVAPTRDARHTAPAIALAN